MAHSFFTGKTLLITGGTGSFGNAVLNRFLEPTLEKSAFSPVTKKSKMICATNTKPTTPNTPQS